MPELPEVETVVRDLRPRLVGRQIQWVQVGTLPLRRQWLDGNELAAVGCRIREVSRRGKWIIVSLTSDIHLLFHLGMTGQLVAVSSRETLAPHTHIVFGLNGVRLHFRDIRRFGSAMLFGSRVALEMFFEEAGLGPEPFDLDPKYWQQRLQATGRCLKAVLLDQRVIAGVGNIYADEALFEAQLHPAQLGRETTGPQAERLRQAVVTVLNRAIERRGSSIRNYVGGDGARGEYQDEFRAYGRTGEPCSRCGTPIQCVRLAGRSTHFCPRCQRRARARRKQRR